MPTCSTNVFSTFQELILCSDKHANKGRAPRPTRRSLTPRDQSAAAHAPAPHTARDIIRERPLAHPNALAHGEPAVTRSDHPICGARSRAIEHRRPAGATTSATGPLSRAAPPHNTAPHAGAMAAPSAPQLRPSAETPPPTAALAEVVVQMGATLCGLTPETQTGPRRPTHQVRRRGRPSSGVTTRAGRDVAAASSDLRAGEGLEAGLVGHLLVGQDRVYRLAPALHEAEGSADGEVEPQKRSRGWARAGSRGELGGGAVGIARAEQHI